ncbi:PAS/PAC sensor hybrid histidine kinase [Caballeronia calidae]|uniref:histidine kinase n=1 Tax=Caballeronia calidae TaxID=1777139 RepID=A0A158DB22_9BURK|nr:ATP-binding protein [Caballeronia calidae]SAK91693.1 PAS/PAC sensor hybrid histidine kinase [Caballeronia calidae]
MTIPPPTPEVIWSRYADAIITAELEVRACRPSDLAQEIDVLRQLADALARGESSILTLLTKDAMHLCSADCAGVTLLEAAPGESVVFKLVATAGHFADAANRTSPVADTPCGMTLASGKPQLFRYPHRYFPVLSDIFPAATESLVVPIPGVNGPLGTLWVVSQRDTNHFDAEDRRILATLASVAGSALRVERTREELGLRAESAEHQVTLAHEAEVRTDSFIAMLSHELRNPLAPIDAALRTIERLSTGNTAALAATGVAQRQMRRLSRLVDDLLDTTRIRHGKLTVKKEHANLGTIVEDAVASVRADVMRLGQRLVVHQPDAPVMVFGDASRLTQVIANVLSNAVKYTPAERGITLNVEVAPRSDGSSNAVAPSTATITVVDEGVGINSSVLPHVFDLFKQSEDRHRQADGGLGIGLAVVKHLVERHDGTVTISSAGEGLGTTVRVTLPSVPVSVEASTTVASRVAPPTQILLVDDDADSAQALEMLLTLDGHEVRTAFSGPAALQVVQNFDPAVAFIDIGMPGMTGVDLLQHLRTRPNLRATKMIALTGASGTDTQAKLIAEGFTEVCTKPLSPERLYQIIIDDVGHEISKPDQ